LTGDLVGHWSFVCGVGDCSVTVEAVKAWTAVEAAVRVTEVLPVGPVEGLEDCD